MISTFKTPAMMGDKRALIMATLVEQEMQGFLNYGFGSAAAVFLVAGAILLTAAPFRRSQERSGDADPAQRLCRSASTFLLLPFTDVLVAAAQIDIDRES